jgi:hypothetical protein
MGWKRPPDLRREARLLLFSVLIALFKFAK